MTLVIRSRTEALDVAPAALAAVRSLDRDLPVGKLEPMSAVLSDSVARSRFTMLLLAVFAGLALLLAVVGVYGVMSYAVNQRTQEIGLRMALGAGRGHVVRLVVSQSMKLVLIGVVAGLGASLLLTRVLSTLLFSVSPTDPLTFTVVALLLAAVTAAASLIPARRAASVDPMVALRYE
jgi:putative ABC transport system permease protein